MSLEGGGKGGGRRRGGGREGGRGGEGGRGEMTVIHCTYSDGTTLFI